jgi:hypothetical protein
LTFEANPYLPPLRDLFARLVTEKAVLYRVSHALEDRKKEIVKSFEVDDARADRVIAGTALWIIDLTEAPVNNAIERFLASAWESRGAQWAEHLDAIVLRESGLAIAQSYETFETFVKDTVARYLSRHPSSLQQLPWRSTQRKGKHRPSDNPGAAWTEYVRLAYGKTFPDLMRRVRQSSPTFARAEQHNSLGADLRSWFGAVTEVRHAATHSNGVIKPARLARLTSLERRHLDVYLGKQQRTPHPRLQVSSQLALRTIEYIAGYAFQLFKALSIEESLSWNPPRRGVTRSAAV